MMNLDDKEIAKRHAAVARSRTFQNLCKTLSLGNLRVLDAGCAYGEHLAFFGPGSVGLTNNPLEVAYGREHGIPITQGNLESLESTELKGTFEMVWANNIFEHLLSPHSFLISLKPRVERDGRIILGVPVVPVFPGLMRLRRFRGALATSHINFFTLTTLRITAEFAGWRAEDIRPFFVPIAWLDRLLAPLAPHLYLIARNDTGFSYDAKKRAEWVDDERYERLYSAVDARP